MEPNRLTNHAGGRKREERTIRLQWNPRKDTHELRIPNLLCFGPNGVHFAVAVHSFVAVLSQVEFDPKTLSNLIPLPIPEPLGHLGQVAKHKKRQTF